MINDFDHAMPVQGKQYQNSKAIPVHAVLAFSRRIDMSTRNMLWPAFIRHDRMLGMCAVAISWLEASRL